MFTIPTSLCPPALADLDVVDGVAQPVFVNPGYEVCPMPLVSRTVIAAVDRQFLAQAHTLRLPKEPPLFDTDVETGIAISPPTNSAGSTPLPVPTFDRIHGSVDLPLRPNG